jgi:hypothetical protein
MVAIATAIRMLLFMGSPVGCRKGLHQSSPDVVEQHLYVRLHPDARRAAAALSRDVRAFKERHSPGYPDLP